ncbi:hypothetical protein SG34_020415 [Thalassomonas viridans]|uniref:Uncharacterized protein n=1 Tax=Thalassomonas viridans TaxID=137584 RepID=A0AAE9YYX1_9GAMM|nr:hypothetical protein [Thalassomonas viridans]WDE03726.1 hypothetical protein SG34_020415 [Thalassomonas viridans]
MKTAVISLSPHFDFLPFSGPLARFSDFFITLGFIVWNFFAATLSALPLVFNRFNGECLNPVKGYTKMLALSPSAPYHGDTFLKEFYA